MLQSAEQSRSEAPAAGQDWSQQAEQVIEDLSQQLQTTLTALLETVNSGTEYAQESATQHIHNLKQGIDQLTEQRLEHLQTLEKKAAQFKEAVTQDVAAHWDTLKNNGRETIQTHPMTSVLLAAGAGLLLGYLFSKHTDK